MPNPKLEARGAVRDALETPRVDAAEVIVPLAPGAGEGHRAYVDAHVARELERELAAREIAASAYRAERDSARDVVRFVRRILHHDHAVEGATKRMEQLAAALAALQQPDDSEYVRVPRDGWQPMESAPKDGTEVLGYREDAGVLLMRWTCPQDFLTDRELANLDEESAEAEDWFYADFVCGGRLDGSEAPTLWMPKPPPPSGTPSATTLEPNEPAAPEGKP